MNNKQIKSTLENMVGKTYRYAGQIHYVKSYNVDEDNDQYTVVTNLSTYSRKFESMPTFLEYWQPTSSLIQSDQSQVMEQENLLSNQLITLLTENIEKVKSDKEYIPQAQTINNNINTIVNIAKMRLEVLKQLHHYPKNNL